ncbi:hypothetical protein PROFUN_06587 [Planoprotostelium fungivorum]|uniref:Uncharacterized protein n=1 Tax=Planoprotostelium fungivorum TaxID=1890364 RepID=A0A2P6MRX2_9EUKA|nr:hypothetical protein PROFUN_06587 [Planoprotostelium fungivorum]
MHETRVPFEVRHPRRLNLKRSLEPEISGDRVGWVEGISGLLVELRIQRWEHSVPMLVFPCGSISQEAFNNVASLVMIPCDHRRR